jgi:hypothetical protein
MEEKIILEITQKTMEVIYAGLLEIPSKYSLSVIQDLEKQLRNQTSKKNNIEEDTNK